MQIDRMIAFCQRSFIYIDRCIPLVSLLASASSPNIWEKENLGTPQTPAGRLRPLHPYCLAGLLTLHKSIYLS
jgi:hypothetical protein